MSQAATVPTAGFRPGRSPAELGPSTDTRLDRTLSAVQNRAAAAAAALGYDDLAVDVGEYVDDLRWHAQTGTAYCEAWRDAKTDATVDAVEDVTGHRLNQGAQGIIGLAIGIMATLMIGVVVLGQIDGFTPNLSSQWSNTADNVSSQSQQTFNFLNLVPFLVVALFILGLMMSRM